MSFEHLKIGDKVTRLVSSAQIPMPLVVTEVEEHVLWCGPWKFSRRNGAEIDEVLGWDETQTGSFLKIE